MNPALLTAATLALPVAALAQDAAPPNQPAQPAEARAVEFTRGFEEGDSHTYTVAIGVSIEQMSGETTLPPQAIAHQLTWRITRDEGNQYTLDITEGELAVRNGDEGATMEIPFADDNPEEDTAAELLTDAEVTFTLTDGGRITNIQGIQSFLDAASDEGLPPQLVGAFMPDQLAQTLTNVLAPADLPGSERTVGGTWTNTRSFPISNAAVFDFTETWTLASVEGAIANAAATIELGLRRPANEDPARPEIALNTFESQADVVYDIEEGLLNRYRVTRAMSTTWSLGELVVNQDDEATVVITRIEQTED